MDKKRLIFDVGIFLAAAEASLLYGSSDAERVHDLADVISSVSGIMFGFLLTSIAMLVAMPESRLMLNMRKTGHLSLLLQELIAGCALHFVTLVTALLAAVCGGASARFLMVAAIAMLVLATIKTGSAGRKLKFVAQALYASR